MADWSRLPEDLLESIARRLFLADLIRFSCVCCSWRSIPPPFLRGKLLPWMIIPSITRNSPGKRKTDEVCDEILGIVCLSDPTHKVYELELPEAANRRICGSSLGWLVTVQTNSELRLLHPFTRAQIQIPPLADFFPSQLRVFLQHGVGFWGYFRDRFIQKAIVGYYSSDSEVMVMVILRMNETLLLCRPRRDLSWTLFERDSSDVIFYEGQFYTVCSSGWVFKVSGLEDDSPHLTVINKPLELELFPENLYLVESSGELLLVSRSSDSRLDDDDHLNVLVDSDKDGTVPKFWPHRTTKFEVFKLNLGRGIWEEVDNLGDRAMLVGYYGSFSVSASEFPGCKGNSIYFEVDDIRICRHWQHGVQDMWLFDLGDGTIQPLFHGNDPLSFMASSVWFSTNPWWRGTEDWEHVTLQGTGWTVHLQPKASYFGPCIIATLDYCKQEMVLWQSEKAARKVH